MIEEESQPAGKQTIEPSPTHAEFSHVAFGDLPAGRVSLILERQIDDDASWLNAFARARQTVNHVVLHEPGQVDEPARAVRSEAIMVLSHDLRELLEADCLSWLRGEVGREAFPDDSCSREVEPPVFLRCELASDVGDHYQDWLEPLRSLRFVPCPSLSGPNVPRCFVYARTRAGRVDFLIELDSSTQPVKPTFARTRAIGGNAHDPVQATLHAYEVSRGLRGDLWWLGHYDPSYRPFVPCYSDVWDSAK